MNRVIYVDLIDVEEAEFEVIKSDILNEGYIPKTVEELNKFELFLKLSPEMSSEEFELRMAEDHKPRT